MKKIKNIKSIIVKYTCGYCKHKFKKEMSFNIEADKIVKRATQTQCPKCKNFLKNKWE